MAPDQESGQDRAVRLAAELEESVRRAFLEITEDDVLIIRMPAADYVDSLAKDALDEARERGDIHDYEYHSVLDPFTQTLHASASVLITVVPSWIKIVIRNPDGDPDVFTEDPEG